VCWETFWEGRSACGRAVLDDGVLRLRCSARAIRYQGDGGHSVRLHRYWARRAARRCPSAASCSETAVSGARGWCADTRRCLCEHLLPCGRCGSFVLVVLRRLQCVQPNRQRGRRRRRGRCGLRVDDRGCRVSRRKRCRRAGIFCACWCRFRGRPPQFSPCADIPGRQRLALARYGACRSRRRRHLARSRRTARYARPAASVRRRPTFRYGLRDGAVSGGGSHLRRVA